MGLISVSTDRQDGTISLLRRQLIAVYSLTHTTCTVAYHLSGMHFRLAPEDGMGLATRNPKPLAHGGLFADVQHTLVPSSPWIPTPPPRPTHPQGKGGGLPLLEKKILQAIIFNAQRESSSQMPDRRPNFSSAKIIICTRKRRCCCCCCRLPPPPQNQAPVEVVVVIVCVRPQPLLPSLAFSSTVLATIFSSSIMLQLAAAAARGNQPKGQIKRKGTGKATVKRPQGILSMGK